MRIAIRKTQTTDLGRVLMQSQDHLLLRRACLSCLFLCLFGFTGKIFANNRSYVGLDSKLLRYDHVERLERESIRLVGSNTMGGIASKWSKEFQTFYPNVRIEIDEKGSSNAIPALVQGQASFGMMSREPKAGEVTAFKDRFGYDPKLVVTGLDMLAVFVHRDNPVKGLTFAELDAIFSSTRRRGAKAKISRWSQLPLDAEAKKDQPIHCFGRNPASGTYGYFKKYALSNGDYGPWVAEMVGSSNLTSAVGRNPNAIGYSGIGFLNPNVRPLAIGWTREHLVEPVAQKAYDGEYPLSRFLYLVVNADPRNELTQAQAEFLRYVHSRQGQQVVMQQGMVPLRQAMLDRVRTSGIENVEAASEGSNKLAEPSSG